MSVALYLESCEGFPKLSITDCEDCQGGKRAGRCPYCIGSPGKVASQDWGPRKSASFTAWTMGATLRAMDVPMRETWDGTIRDLLLGLTLFVDASRDHAVAACHREIVRFVARALLHPGVTLDSPVYCA